MKLFILDKCKITKFNLPEKIEDSFLIPYMSTGDFKENMITVEAEQEKWYLKSNGNVNVINGKVFEPKTILEEYKIYSLKILNQDEIISLVALPDVDAETYKIQFNKLTSITIGSDSNANIFYNNLATAQMHAEIKVIDNCWHLLVNNDEAYKTYVNEERVINNQKLKIGDVIFINGLKIIWMNNFIKINNPIKSVTVKGFQPYQDLEGFDIANCPPVTDEEGSVDLYNEDDYFFHSPRMRTILEEEEVQIDPPPGSQIGEELPLILTLGSSLTMTATSLMSGYNIIYNVSSGKSTILASLPSIVTCGTMIVGSLILPRITASYQKKKRKKKERKRQQKYKAYLLEKEKEINLILNKQSQILKENNPTATECAQIIEKNDRTLWSREIVHDDFCTIRLGIGNIPARLQINAPEKHFTLDEDNLFEMVYEVVNKSKNLNDVPVNISLLHKNVISFLCNCTYKNKYINNLILQLVTLQSSTDLKIIILTNKQNEKNWEYAKYLPHCWSDDKSVRFFATNSEEMKNVSNFLEEEYKNRKEQLKERDEEEKEIKKEETYKNFLPYYIIITDNYKNAKNIPIVDKILKAPINIGFSFVAIGNYMAELPNKCDDFIELGETESCISEMNINSQTQQTFKNECDPNIDMKKASIVLSNIPVISKEGISTLPTSLSFLEMYGVSKIEHLNIANRWKSNDPVTSLSTPIGVHADGEEFKLDLHEKFHGPHGLIAGSTGSGKSEFIITYILSMCVNFHPYEVQFVLIDYKGGGLAGAFQNKETGVKMPHLVGTITNLDTASMNRTLVSIQSELKRRQRIFNEVKDQLGESTIDIYKYQKFYREGLIKNPMAHLFIISDEFAELKAQQPEFLQELVSTARIGRSLGVHLILATQKPSGVVNDQIWSNSKFKICLKVQDKSDSMEMLKRPEAASIKETGRFYLQVGYDDYFDIGQSGWGGAKYIPSDKITKKVDDSIAFVDNTGHIIKSINEIVKKDPSQDYGDQLTNIVKYIYNLGQKEQLVESQLWLDAIPDTIYVGNLRQKYNYKPVSYLVEPVIGEYDNPKAQSQGLLNVRISQKNTLIYGENGSGKENLLTTLLYSSMIEHTPEEISFYIIDCGAEVLKMFYKMPHVGEIATVDENDKIMGILTMIDEELESRKDLFSDYAGNYQNYIENSGKKLPIINLIINNYEIFSETYNKLADLLPTLYRDGAKYGISFTLSCVTTNSVRARVMQYFDNKIALRVPDVNDYRNLVNAPKGLVPTKCFGRGLVQKDDTAYEFQTAYIGDSKEINKIIQTTAAQLNNAYTTRAKKIKSIPNIVTIDTVIEKLDGLKSIPLGYEMATKEVLSYNFTENKINIITGENVSAEIPFIQALIKEIKSINNINLRVIDFVNAIKIEDIQLHNDKYDQAFGIINNEIVAETKSEKTNIYILVGASALKEKLKETGKTILNNLFMASSTFKKSYFILIDNYSGIKTLQLEDWYQTEVDNTSGIWIGPNIGSQVIINLNNLSMEERKINFPQIGFSIRKGNHTIIKHVIDVEEKNEK